MSHPISDKLIAWYEKNQRSLPWRGTKDPYKIWLSEIILQQTQVAQGLSYYNKFIEEFPTVIDLATAHEDKVLRLWQGLGYYSRARNLHTAAKTIYKNHQGCFPKNYQEIKQLKGVGDYTAAAIASFAFQLPYAVVDGNVYRVLARLFNIATPINSTQGKKEFQLLANELLNNKKAAQHNNAIMELGALICKPQNPKCESCPVQTFCLASQKKLINELPVKDKKIKIKSRYFNYFILNVKDKVYIQKRTEKDIWQNLFEFFLIETSQIIEAPDVLKNPELKKIAKKFKVLSINTAKKHILSHQHIYAVFYEIELDSTPKTSSKLIAVKRDKLNTYAFPQLIHKYLSEE